MTSVYKKGHYVRIFNELELKVPTVTYIKAKCNLQTPKFSGHVFFLINV